MTDHLSFLSSTARRMEGSAIRRMGARAAAVPGMISFAPGYPDPATFAWDDLRTIADDLLTERERWTLQYGPTRGFGWMLDALVQIVAARHITATTDQAMVTTGSQQGLDLVARLLIDPGDAVLVELPTYTGAIAAFKSAGAALAGVRQDGDGIDLEDLDRVLARERAAGRRIPFLYVVPNFQNPTGILIGLEKRRQLLAWARNQDMLIVEDDPYGALYFDDVTRVEETRPIKADDEDGRVIYLSSFSKTLAPGLRVAWTIAGAPFIERMERIKEGADLCVGSLDQRIVFEAWKRGLLMRNLGELRAVYRDKREVMEAALAEHLGGALTWRQPRGGFFVWAALPEGQSSEALLEHAIANKVIYVPGRPFFVDGSGANYLRLAFSFARAEQIVEGIQRLAMVVIAHSRV